MPGTPIAFVVVAVTGDGWACACGGMMQWVLQKLAPRRQVSSVERGEEAGTMIRRKREKQEKKTCRLWDYDSASQGAKQQQQ